MSRVPAVLVLVGVALAWGAIPLIVREDLPASQLVGARTVLGAATLWFALFLRKDITLPRIHWGRLLAAGLLLATHWVAFFLAIKETTVAVALATLYLGPVLVVLAAPRILGERTSIRGLAGLGIAVAGTLLVARPGSGGTTAGIAAGLVAAVTMAALILVVKPVATAIGGLKVAATALLVAALVMSPWAVQAAGATDLWPELLLLGIVFTGIGWALYWWSVGLLPVAVVGILMYLEPAAAVAWAAAVLGESPDALAWLGVALVIVGGGLATVEARMEETTGAPAIM
jgi:drug/metabolite transporter (DMT)-like permease